MGTALATTWRSGPRLHPRSGAARSTGRPVVAAVDVSDGADLGMARRVLDAARRAGGPLHVVHACHIVGESTLACGIRGLSRTSMRLLRRRTREDRLERLSVLVDDPAATLHVLHGRVHRVVDRVARQVGAGLIVLGSPAPPLVPGFLPGGTVALLSGGTFPLLLVPRYPAPSAVTSPPDLPASSRDRTESSKDADDPRSIRPTSPGGEHRFRAVPSVP